MYWTRRRIVYVEPALVLEPLAPSQRAAIFFVRFELDNIDCHRRASVQNHTHAARLVSGFLPYFGANIAANVEYWNVSSCIRAICTNGSLDVNRIDYAATSRRDFTFWSICTFEQFSVEERQEIC